jgi:peptide/nickel transport system ATP-binding protein
VLERKPKVMLHAVDGVSFEIEKGKTLALVGESGCGKSTVARLMVGLYQPTRGSFSFDGMDAHATYNSPAGRKLRERIQMIFQDPYASLNPRWTVEDIIGEPLKEHGIISDEVQLKTRVGAEVPAPVLRRAAPAYLHSASLGHRAGVLGVR